MALDILERLRTWRRKMPTLWYGNADLDAAIAELEQLRGGAQKAGACGTASEIDTVGWAILQALHEGVEDGPQSWSDLAEDQEKRIKKAAIAAIEAVTDLSQYAAQGFALPLTEKPSKSYQVLEGEDGWYGLAQLRTALADIDISAYNAAKWRIGKAMAVLSKALDTADATQSVMSTQRDGEAS